MIRMNKGDSLFAPCGLILYSFSGYLRSLQEGGGLPSLSDEKSEVGSVSSSDDTRFTTIEGLAMFGF